MENDVNIDIANLKSNDCVLFKFPIDEYDVEQAQEMHEKLVKDFPDNTVITFPDDCSIEFFEKEEVIKWAENLIKALGEDYD